MTSKYFFLVIFLLKVNIFFCCKKKDALGETRVSNMVEMKPRSSTVRFYVFTSDKQAEIDIKQDNLNIINKICDPKEKNLYKFIVHGFAEAWNMTFRWNWVEDMKRELLISSDSQKLCVIAVDWEDLGRGGKIIANYWTAIENMKYTAELMSEYTNKNRMNEKNFHCIGFSLGAHMCSIFYKTYFNKYNIKPFRITGLDPAGPFFGSKPNTEKLHYTDGELVDIIHTSDKFGLADKNGHLDFYPDLGPSELNACSDIKNRYTNQENVILYEEESNNNLDSGSYNDVVINSTYIEQNGGMDKISVGFLKTKFFKLFEAIKEFWNKKPKRVFINVHQFFGCSHLMSVRYFIYSINECDYKAYLCKTKSDFSSNKCDKNAVQMGYYTDKAQSNYLSSFGDFFLNTTTKPPYCDEPKNYKKSPGLFKNKKE